MIVRNPMEICIFTVMPISVARGAIGHLPPSLQDTPLLGQAACIAIFVGCVMAIVGIIWRDRDDGLVIEQFGLVPTGLGSFFYAAALLATDGSLTDIAIAAGMATAIGTACVFRFVQIQRYVGTRKTIAAVRARVDGDGAA
jgi:hypothetical protein